MAVETRPEGRASNPMSKRDERIEQWIESHGARWEFRTVGIAHINRRRSLENQARFEPLNEETTLLYASAMERGDLFPPIVVFEEGSQLVVIDGNHRVEGAEINGTAEVGAYVVLDVSPRLVQTMTFEANTRHGLPSSVEERIAHGLYLVDAGVTQKDAARLVNVTLQQLRAEVERARASRRLASTGLDRWQAIPSHGRGRLSALSNDVVLQHAARLVIESKMSGPSIDRMVTEVNKETTEATQIAVLDDWRGRYANVIMSTAGGRFPAPTAMTKLSRVLSLGEHLVVDEVRDATPSLTDDQRRAFARRVEAVVATLSRVREMVEGRPGG